MLVRWAPEGVPRSLTTSPLLPHSFRQACAAAGAPVVSTYEPKGTFERAGSTEIYHSGSGALVRSLTPPMPAPLLCRLLPTLPLLLCAAYTSS